MSTTPTSTLLTSQRSISPKVTYPDFTGINLEPIPQSTINALIDTNKMMELIIASGQITDRTTRGPARSPVSELSTSPRPPIPEWSYPTTKENSPDLENHIAIPILAPGAQRFVDNALQKMEEDVRKIIKTIVDEGSEVSEGTRRYAEAALDELNETSEEDEEEEQKEKGKQRAESPRLIWPPTDEGGWPIHTTADWTPEGLSTVSPSPDGANVHPTVLRPEQNWNAPTDESGWPIPITEQKWGNTFPDPPNVHVNGISFPAHGPSQPFGPDETEPPLPFFRGQIAVRHIHNSAPFKPVYLGAHIPISLHVMAVEPNARLEVVRALRTIRDCGLASDLHRYERLTRDITGANKKIRDYEVYRQEAEIAIKEVEYRLLAARAEERLRAHIDALRPEPWGNTAEEKDLEYAQRLMRPHTPTQERYHPY